MSTGQDDRPDLEMSFQTLAESVSLNPLQLAAFFWPVIRDGLDERTIFFIEGVGQRWLAISELETFFQRGINLFLYFQDSQRLKATLKEGYLWASESSLRLAENEPNPPDTLKLFYNLRAGEYLVAKGMHTTPPAELNY